MEGLQLVDGWKEVGSDRTEALRVVVCATQEDHSMLRIWTYGSFQAQEHSKLLTSKQADESAWNILLQQLAIVLMILGLMLSIFGIDSGV